MAAGLPPEVDYLLDSVRSGRALAVLGAGAARTGLTRRGQAIKTGSDLAAELCRIARFPYNGESLPEVVQGCVGPRISQKQFDDLIRVEYTECSGGADLLQLFSYPWARAYTFNVDDAVERFGRLPDGRRTAPFNAMVDHVVTIEATTDLQIIHLNGVAAKPEHGFIFSQDEYFRKLGDQKNFWYAELASDYHRFVPVVIGSSLNEPLLLTELERVKQRQGHSGKAFLVVPDDLSPIQQSALSTRNITHLKMTLTDFVGLLRREIGDLVKAVDVVREVHLGIRESDLQSLTQQDIRTAMALRPVSVSGLRNQLGRQSPADHQRRAQFFLQGSPPDWPIALSDVPVDLENGKQFVSILSGAITAGSRLVVITGMAGSGKTTLAMRSLLKTAADGTEYPLYELSGEAASFARVFELLQKLHPTRRVLLFINDLALYGDRLASDLETISGNHVVIVATARLSEWNEHFRRFLGAVAVAFELKRFESADFQPLTDRLLRYVPAPAFRRASVEERLQRFSRSRNQLLIALREITESRRFDEVIEDEWSKIKNDTSRRLFFLVGIATIARVGISPHLAAGICTEHFQGGSFDEAIDALQGIVVIDRDNRLRVRHEIYAEHVFDIETIEEYVIGIKYILTALARYEVPLITRLNKNDASLFRWLLNAKSLYIRCNRMMKPSIGLVVYENFEKMLELDGHFWLQYGLYCRRLGLVGRALDYFGRSIQAYPQNEYAIHALADLQLQIAADPATSPTQSRTYMEEAAAELSRLDIRQSLEGDLYPIVTLGTRHVGALIAQGLTNEALVAARRYFERVRELNRRVGLPILEQLQHSLLLYHSTGVWEPVRYDVFSAEWRS